MPDNTAAIARIRALLNTGATSAQVDGEQVTIDQKALRQRLRELEATDDAAPVKRPRIASIDLSRCW